jgi:tetratricopeptide (TPR) repeat protein
MRHHDLGYLRPIAACMVSVLTVGFAMVAGFAIAGEGDAEAENIGEMTFGERKMMAIAEKQEAIFRQFESKEGELSEMDVEELQFRVRTLAQEYESLIADDPDEVLVYILYGKLLRKVGQEERAAKMFLKADDLDPKIAVVKQQLGNYLAEHGKFTEALGFLLQATTLSPETAVYHYQIGELLNVFRDSFIADGLYLRGSLDSQMKAAFAESARLAPGNRDFRLRFAECFYDLENPDWEESLALWGELMAGAESDHEQQAIHLHEANVLIKLARYEEAREHIEQVTLAVLAPTQNELLDQLPDAEEKLKAAE